MDQAKPTLENKRIKCPFCEKEEIDITIISEHMSVHTSRAAGRRARILIYHAEGIEIHNKCPNCYKSKKEIKEYLEKGKKPITHKERLEMLKRRGLPLVLESK